MPSPGHQPKSPSFYIADPELREDKGHYLVYARTVAAEAEKHGFTSTILAHRGFDGNRFGGTIKPAFRYTMWELPKSGALGAAIGFFRDLRSAVRSGGIDSDSIVFGPSVSGLQILGWALFALANMIGPKPRIIVLLRYQREIYQSALARLGFRILEVAARRARLQMVTDSHRLAQDYRDLTSLSFGVVPIPHGERDKNSAVSKNKSKLEHPPRRPRKKLRFVSLGNARDEKGIMEIFAAIQVLAELGLDRKLEFVLQVNAPYPDAIAADIDKARQTAKKNVTFIDRQLSAGEYEALLESADAMLLPYWPSVYRSRTSGPFTEAIAIGKPVIVSKDTWMADFVEIASFCELCTGHDPIDIARAILSLAHRIENKTVRCKEFRKAWCDYHNAQHFMHVLLQSDFHLPFMTGASHAPRNALVVLPWNYSSIKLSGAGVRISTMLRFLMMHFDCVHLIEPAPSPATELPQGVIQHVIDPENGPALAISRVAAEIAYVRHGTKNADNNIRIWNDSWFVYWFLRYRFSRRAKQAFRSFLATHSIQTIFVEYPFAIPMVTAAAAKGKTPVIATNYDVLSNGIFDSWIAAWVNRLEISALAKADNVVSITADDEKLFQAKGLRSTIVPNSIDPGRLRYHSRSKPRTLLAKQGINLPKGIIALFLGSRHYPNIEAANQLKSLAESEVMAGSKSRFVVAGDCIPPESGSAFLSLGVVSDETLVALYSVSDFIVVPLRYGTGSSIKTIEAMALGKVVIGTSVGFRGLPVQNGIECIIEDDLSKYPGLIAELIGDQDRMRKISQAAQQFGEKYDFRKTYMHYLDLAGYSPRFPSTNGATGEHSSHAEAPQGLRETISRRLTAQAKLAESQSSFTQSQHQLVSAQEELEASSNALRQALQLLNGRKAASSRPVRVRKTNAVRAPVARQPPPSISPAQ